MPGEHDGGTARLDASRVSSYQWNALHLSSADRPQYLRSWAITGLKGMSTVSSGAFGLLVSGLMAFAVVVKADDALLEAPRWRFFNDPQDISSLYINDLVQEIGGSVWLATDRGLVRYDGMEFLQMQVPDVPEGTQYNCLLYSADGTVWIGTNVGVLRYIGREWDYPITSGNVTALTEAADGTIWVGISPSSTPDDADETNPLPAVSANSGIHTYSRGRWRHYSARDGIPSLPVRALYGDHEGGVWAIFSTSARTEALYRFQSGRWSDVERTIQAPEGEILTIAQTRDGAYWFGTYRRGVWRLKDGRWETFRDHPDLSTFTAASLLPMPDGSLWAVGSPAGTFYQFAEGTWRSYPVRQVGITGRVVSKIVYVLDDAFWFVIPGRGVARFDRRGGPWWTYGQEHGLPATGSISHVAQGVDRTVWCGTTAGLVRYDGQRFTTPPKVPHVSDEQITALLTWPDGKVWVASGSPVSIPGIWQLDRSGWVQLSTTPVLDQEAAITAILRARSGDIWVGTSEREGAGGYGVFRLHADRWQRYTVNDGLADDVVFSLAEDPAGAVWVGTPHGVSRFDGEHWASFTHDDSLRSLYGWTLAATSDGAIWVGGNKPNAGLSRYQNGV